MNKKQKLRKMKVLMYDHTHSTKERIKTFLTDLTKHNSKIHTEWVLGVNQIYKLSDELNFTETEVEVLWNHVRREKYRNHTDYNQSPPKEGRDNKDVHVGGGGSNRCMIRYPSKKRSIKTWKKFYKLFPWAAERDGWDGKTSNRMK